MQAELFWIECGRPGRLAVLPRPRGGDWLEDEIPSLRTAGVNVLVSLLTREEIRELALAEESTFCAANGIEFFSFPIADRGVPAPASDNTLGLVRKLAAFLTGGKAVAIHCRQGVGRSVLRTEGGSVGTSMAQTIQERREQFHLSRLPPRAQARV
jgi:hypothetical protein